MKHKFPLYRPPELKGRYLGKVLRSRWLTEGPMCERLLAALEPVVGVPRERLVLAASATQGFEAALAALRETGAGRAVATVATWAGIRTALQRHNGLRREGRRICVATQIGGSLFDEGDPLAAPGDLVLQDFSHSWHYRKDIASWGVASMYPTKLVPGAEGGVVVCPDEVSAAAVRRLLHCGIASLFHGGNLRSVVPQVNGLEVPFKGNLTDVAAALGLEALGLHRGYVRDIADAWGVMFQAFEERGLGVDVHGASAERKYLFQVRSKTNSMGEVRCALLDKGIPTAVNFPPRENVTLPLFPGMTKAQAQAIARAWEAVRE